MDRKSILKKKVNITPAYSGLSSAYHSLVNDFFIMQGNYSNQQLKEFFSALRLFDYRTNMNKLFTVSIEDMKSAGYFYFNRSNIERQIISINPSNSVLNTAVKKAIIFTSFLHEQAHEHQFDKALHYAKTGRQINNNFDKCIFLGMNNISQLDMHHDFFLHEIFAEINTCKQFYNLMKRQTIPTTFENLYLLGSYCVRVFKNINLLTTHESFADEPDIKSHKLIQLYKKVFKNIQYNTHSVGILNHDLVFVKCRNINFINLERILDNEFEKFYELFLDVFEQLLPLFKPSAEFVKGARANGCNGLNELWDKFNRIEIGNIVILDITNQLKDKELETINKKIKNLTNMFNKTAEEKEQ